MNVFTVVRDRILVGNFTQRKFVFDTINTLDSTSMDKLFVYDLTNKQYLPWNYNNLCKCFRDRDVVEIMVKQDNVYTAHYSIWQTEMNAPRAEQSIQDAQNIASKRVENYEEETKDSSVTI